MKILLITTFISLTAITYGQQPVIDKITSEICETLSKVQKPLEEISYEESRNIISAALVKNYSEWIKELNEYKIKSGKTKVAEYDFDQYFQHVLQMDCQNFRKIHKYFDTYLSEKENLRPLHLKTKEFVMGLEDKLNNKELNKFLNYNLDNEDVDTLLNASKFKIDKCKRTTLLSIVLTYNDGYTFRVRYFDYLTNKPEFQIDVVYSDDTDLNIDNLILKDKAQLLVELKERLDFNRKVDSGEIKLPPPPKKNR